MIEQSDSLRCSPRRPFQWPTAIPNEVIIDDSDEIKRHVETRTAVALIRKKLDQMEGPGTFAVLGLRYKENDSRRLSVCSGNERCACIYCDLDRIESHTLDLKTLANRVGDSIR